MTVRKDGILID